RRRPVPGSPRQDEEAAHRLRRPAGGPRPPRLQAVKRAVADLDRDRVEDLEREDALGLLVEEADERPRAVALLDERGGEQLRRRLERARAVDVPGTERMVAQHRPGAVRSEALDLGGALLLRVAGEGENV